MAKRFTDTAKYKKEFIRSLPGAYKLLWDFLCLDCDHAGIWHVDFAAVELYIGSDMPVDKKTALDLFNKDEVRIIELKNGKNWFIAPFIEFQYGKLSEKNRAHTSVISVLKKYNLIDSELLIKPLISPLQGDKEQDKEQEQEMEMDKGGAGEKFLIPEMLKVWKKHNPKYPANKAKDFPPLQSLAVFICEQDNLNYHAREPDDDAKILTQWGSVSAFIVTHNHFKNYNLILVEKHIQAIFSTIQNAGTTNGNSKTNAGTKPGTSAARMQTARDW